MLQLFKHMQQKLQMNHLVGESHVYKSILHGRDVCEVDGAAVVPLTIWTEYEEGGKYAKGTYHPVTTTGS